MSRFWTSDLHFGHANIIDYCGRPYASVEEMNLALIENWNDTVGKDDTVMILGDFALGKLVETLELVSLLPGHKILLAGNHDRCWHGHRKGVESQTQRYLDAGFAEIWQGSVELEVGGVNVLTCHFPYRGDSRNDGDRYTEHRPVDHGQWLLHGHVHERWKVRGRMINVGVDVWSYRPVAENEIVGLVRG